MNRIDAFEAMLARGPDNEMLRFSLGNACLAEARHADAIEHLRRAVELKTDYSAAWKQLGRALAANGEPAEALVAFDRGLEVAEGNGDKQTAKEIAVFRRRAARALDIGGDAAAGTSGGTGGDSGGGVIDGEDGGG